MIETIAGEQIVAIFVEIHEQLLCVVIFGLTDEMHGIDYLTGNGNTLSISACCLDGTFRVFAFDSVVKTIGL